MGGQGGGGYDRAGGSNNGVLKSERNMRNPEQRLELRSSGHQSTQTNMVLLW